MNRNKHQILSPTPASKWLIFSRLDAQIIYFAPECWESWNATAKGVFHTKRNLVFEYRTPKLPGAKDKITLRGLVPDPTPKNNLPSVVGPFCWDVPRSSQAKVTQGYAVWRCGGSSKNTRHQAPPYPANGFPSANDFLDWLDRWEKGVGSAAPGSIWNFISTI